MIDIALLWLIALCCGLWWVTCWIEDFNSAWVEDYEALRRYSIKADARAAELEAEIEDLEDRISEDVERWSQMIEAGEGNAESFPLEAYVTWLNRGGLPMS